MKSKQKECAACHRKSVPEVLVCQNCQRPFLDRTDATLLVLGGTVSFITALIWAFMVNYASFILVGIFINIVVIMSGLFIIKTMQKIKNHERQVVKEIFYNSYQSQIYSFYLVFPLIIFLGFILEYVGISGTDFINATDQYSLMLIDCLEVFFYSWLLLSILVFRRGLLVFDRYSYLVGREYKSFDSPFMLAKQYKQEFRIYVGGQSVVVDRDSFQPLGRIYQHEYSKDRNGIYCDIEKVLPDADIETFELLSHPDDRFAYYGRDKNAVYYLDDESPCILPEVDPQRVEVFYDGLLLGAGKLFKREKQVLEIKEPDSFEVLDGKLAKDNAYLYYIGRGVPHVVEGVNPVLMKVNGGYVFENGKSYCVQQDQFKVCELATEDQLKEWLEMGLISDDGYREGLDRLDLLRRSERLTGE